MCNGKADWRRKIMAKQIAQTSLNFTGLYESELLVEMLLRY